MQTLLRLAAAGRIRPSATRRRRLPPVSILFITCWWIAIPGALFAQQFVTDDAAIVEFGACQLEAWHGETASWILPACQAVRNLEFTAGIGFLAEDGGRAAEYAVEGKYLVRDVEVRSLGIGVVGGLEFGSITEVLDGRADAYAYVPIGVALGEDRLLLHGNVGWHYENDRNDDDGVVQEGSAHALTWGLRADLLLPLGRERFTLIGELFGEHHGRPEYQVGLRSSVIADRLLLDVSWGGHTAAGEDGAGWTAGITWTPPAFF